MVCAVQSQCLAQPSVIGRIEAPDQGQCNCRAISRAGEEVDAQRKRGVRLRSHPSLEGLQFETCVLVFFTWPCDCEVVRHFEYSGHGVSAYASDVLIGLTAYHAVE